MELAQKEQKQLLPLYWRIKHSLNCIFVNSITITWRYLFVFVDFNEIGDEGAKAIADTLLKNRSLSLLYLSDFYHHNITIFIYICRQWWNWCGRSKSNCCLSIEESNIHSIISWWIQLLRYLFIFLDHNEIGSEWIKSKLECLPEVYPT